jgi:pantoate--beta-alanine ligase
MVVCPTVRDPDGLALSSRNAYLSPAERAQAAVLHAALQDMQAAVRRGQTDCASLVDSARRRIEAAGPCRIGYIELVDPRDVHPVETITGDVLAALAVTIGGCRLIDNLLIEDPARKR